MGRKLDEKAVIAEFRKRYRRQMAMTFSMIGVLAIVMLGYALEGENAGLFHSLLFPVAFVAMGIAVFFRYHNWRCPACGEGLGRHWRGSFCDECGARLR